MSALLCCSRMPRRLPCRLSSDEDCMGLQCWCCSACSMDFVLPYGPAAPAPGCVIAQSTRVLDMADFYNDAVNEPDFNFKEDYKCWTSVSV